MSSGGEDENRYTIVLTGRYGKDRSYLVVDEEGSYEQKSGFPPTERIRGEISFDDLPEAAKQEVLKIYRKTWNL